MISLDLNFLHGIAFLSTLAFIIASVSFFKNAKVDRQLAPMSKLVILLNRTLHTLTFLLQISFIFVFKRTLILDLLYLIYVSTVFIMYKINGECIISIHEKKTIDPSYVPGSNPKYEPWIDVMLGATKYKSPLSIILCFIAINVLVISFEFVKQSIRQ